MRYSALECYVMDKLQCGSADLKMLDEVYSTLAEDSCDVSGIVDRATDLNELLEQVYTCITEEVQLKLKEMANEIHILVCINDKATYLDMTEENREQLLALTEMLSDNYPYANCLDTSFQNDLDNVVDFEATVGENAEALIQYWAENDEFIIYDETEVKAECFYEDGSDQTYDAQYTIRGKRLFEYDDLICDFAEDEELDENFIAQQICDRECGCVKTIKIGENVIYKK